MRKTIATPDAELAERFPRHLHQQHRHDPGRGSALRLRDEVETSGDVTPTILIAKAVVRSCRCGIRASQCLAARGRAILC
ncbi:MAG: hypothetical protein R2851_03950 [Caldilineaceae bacterium]